MREQSVALCDVKKKQADGRRSGCRVIVRRARIARLVFIFWVSNDPIGKRGQFSTNQPDFKPLIFLEMFILLG